MQLKEKVHAACLQLLTDKIRVLQDNLKALTQGAENDNKSSAGDKHETARAMMQLEQEKLSKQLDDLLKQRDVLLKIDTKNEPRQITKGSLVKTNKGYLFLSIPLGKLSMENIDVIVLSPQSPLGLKLLGLTTNTSVHTNGINYLIEEIS